MIENEKTTANLDSSDCLEAVIAFRSFKNLMFLLALICLIALQGIFWANYLGCIDKIGCPCPEAKPAAVEAGARWVPAETAVVALAAETAVAGDTQPVETTADACGGCAPVAGVFNVASVMDALKNPTCREMICIIATLNYILFLAVILFVLNLLITLKISIAGRLGGINHISRAFLQGLLLVVLIVPWQVCLPDTVVGAIYTPKELLCSDVVKCGGALYDCVFYFGRFVGLWAIVIILLLAAEIRSVRWSRAVIRRLGILK